MRGSQRRLGGKLNLFANIKNWWVTTPWLCKVFGCRWEHVAGSVKKIIEGTITWNRRCYRCKTEQDLSRCLGFGFLEAERKFVDEQV